MRSVRADGMLSATALLGLCLWLFNDHVLKHVAPGILSGKLSDVASLIVLPLAFQAAWELTRAAEGFAPARSAIVMSCVLTGAFFVFMETTELGSLAFRAILALLQWPFRSLLAGRVLEPQLVRHWADAEDLVALPALWLPLRVGLLRARSQEVSVSEQRARKRVHT